VTVGWESLARDNLKPDQLCKLLFTVTIKIRNFVGSLCHRPYSKRAVQPILCSPWYFCMKHDVFNETTTQSNPQSTALHTIHKQRHSIVFVFSERAFRPSVVCLSVCLSSVTVVHPTQPVEIFRNVSSPFGTLTSR